MGTVAEHVLLLMSFFTLFVQCEASDTKPVCLRVTLRSGISVLSRMEARKFRNIPFLSAHDWNRTELTGPIDELSVVATSECGSANLYIN